MNTILDPMALWGKPMSRDQMVALIGAAPELLEALRDLDALWSENEANAVDFSHAIEQARRAIAKATRA